MIGRPTGGSGSGPETLREVRKWLGEPPEVRKWAGDPPPRSGSGQETLREVRKWSGDPQGGTEVYRETLIEVRK